MKFFLFVNIILIFFSLLTKAKEAPKVNHELLNRKWDAHWISHPEHDINKSGIYLFRKDFNLNNIPQSFIINISADNRYKLYVNGKFITYGPSRGDLMHWHFATIDIAKHLNKGKNVIGVKVWNFGKNRPAAQISAGTGLIIQGNTKKESLVNTTNSWKVLKDTSYSIFPINHLDNYYVAGPGEKFNCNKHPWKWLETNYNTKNWHKAKTHNHGITTKNFGATLPKRLLTPREIPQMELKFQKFQNIRRSKGINNANYILNAKNIITIPAHSKATILLDQGHLTNAYPNLIYGKGKGSKIKLTYAESLFKTKQKNNKKIITSYKGNRNVIKNKKIKGNYDIIICDGGRKRYFETLQWRTFRYVQIKITTKEEPLIIQRISSRFTAYPLKEKASFQSNNPLLKKIWKTGWRTQRLCAGETFFDTPYYEQLQYLGDTKVQSLITFYASGDTTLWRKAIKDFHNSRLTPGLTQSRYPSRNSQIIPTYSLIWINMLHDYYMHCRDKAFIEDMIPTVMEILNWFNKHIQPSGLPGQIEGWNFTDWVNHKGWQRGVPPQTKKGQSSIIALQYAYTIKKAVKLFHAYNMHFKAANYKRKMINLKKAVYKKCKDHTRNLIADTPEKKHFSQHANIMGILTGVFNEKESKKVVKKIINDTSIAQCSYYFKYYLAEALKKSGTEQLYTQLLDPWQNMLKKDLSTFAEEPAPSRSDCHAWSASPVYHFLSLICGIEPAKPGFKEVKIAPHFGNLNSIKGKMPHHKGIIKLNLEKNNNQVSGNIYLPKGLKGHFFWKNQEIELKGGTNKINF